MGSLLSRGNNDIEQIDINSSPSYVYPPPSGTYFGSHFFMGGKKFDIAQPEAYLFGDNSDLNFLGPKPFMFPYQPPNGDQPVRALKCLINIRKDSVRLIRIPSPQIKPEDIIANVSQDEPAESRPSSDALYNIEFTFDADCPCAITVYYNASEAMCNKAAVFTTKSPADRSDPIHFNAGCNQQFCLTSHVIDPTLLSKDKPSSWEFSNIPIAIQAIADCGPEHAGHSHIMYASFEKLSGDVWTIKATKQKQMISGVGYIIQEIYGIENKQQTTTEDGNTDSSNALDDDDDNSECVVCLSDPRDTLILPCKHLCLCSTCANQLRFQQSGCPICRQSFRALLQIRAVRKKVANLYANAPNSSSIPEEADEEDDAASTESADEGSSSNPPLPYEVTVPAGYEVVPLISAINGPASSASLSSLATTRDGTRAPSVASNASASSSSLRRSGRKKKNKSPAEPESETQFTSSVAVESEESFRSNDRKKSKKRSMRKTRKEMTENDPSDVVELAVVPAPLLTNEQPDHVDETIDPPLVTEVAHGSPLPNEEDVVVGGDHPAPVPPQQLDPPEADSATRTSGETHPDVTTTDEEAHDAAAETDQSGSSSNTSTNELLSSYKVMTMTSPRQETLVEDGDDVINGGTLMISTEHDPNRGEPRV